MWGKWDDKKRDPLGIRHVHVQTSQFVVCLYIDRLVDPTTRNGNTFLQNNFYKKNLKF